jgi:hypothetical protein
MDCTCPVLQTANWQIQYHEQHTETNRPFLLPLKKTNVFKATPSRVISVVDEMCSVDLPKTAFSLDGSAAI